MGTLGGSSTLQLQPFGGTTTAVGAFTAGTTIASGTTVTAGTDLIATNNVTTGNGYLLTYKAGDTNKGVKVIANNADGASYSSFNGGLESWYGIGFRCSLDNTTRFVWDTRSGNSSQTGSATSANVITTTTYNVGLTTANCRSKSVIQYLNTASDAISMSLGVNWVDPTASIVYCPYFQGLNGTGASPTTNAVAINPLGGTIYLGTIPSTVPAGFGVWMNGNPRIACGTIVYGSSPTVGQIQNYHIINTTGQNTDPGLFTGISGSSVFQLAYSTGGGYQKWYQKGILNICADSPSAVPNGYMTSGSLTIGDTAKDYGGGSGWNGATAGLLMECADKTEIAVHDSALRIASPMYYSGPYNIIHQGRDMGWGYTNINVTNHFSVGDPVNSASNSNAVGRMVVRDAGGLLYNPSAWSLGTGLLITSDSGTIGTTSTGLCLSHSTTGYCWMSSLTPSIAWRDLVLGAATTYVQFYGSTGAYMNPGGWTNVSDRRYKREIRPIKTGRSLERVLKARPVQYKRIYKENQLVPETTKEFVHIGLIAQECQEINPHCVSEHTVYEGEEKTEETRLGITYNDWILHLIGSVQEQQTMIATLTEQNRLLVDHARQLEKDFSDFRDLTEQRFTKIATWIMSQGEASKSLTTEQTDVSQSQP